MSGNDLNKTYADVCTRLQALWKNDKVKAVDHLTAFCAQKGWAEPVYSKVGTRREKGKRQYQYVTHITELQGTRHFSNGVVSNAASADAEDWHEDKDKAKGKAAKRCLKLLKDYLKPEGALKTSVSIRLIAQVYDLGGYRGWVKRGPYGVHELMLSRPSEDLEPVSREEFDRLVAKQAELLGSVPKRGDAITQGSSQVEGEFNTFVVT